MAPSAGFTRSGAVACLLAALVVPGVASSAAARQLAPTADVRERFTSDPASNSSWQLAGPWRWDGAHRKLLSAATGQAEAYWLAADHFAGTLTVRLRLVSGRGRRAPKARLVFARDPESGAFRYVELTGGTRGRVVLGQSGQIGGSEGGTIRARRFPVGRGVWLKASVRVDRSGAATVKLGRKKVFTAPAGALAPGEVGVAALSSRVTLDSVVFVADPDGEPCLECHAGQPGQPLAPNVATYWDGSWWRANRGGSAGEQHGGHGDPGGKAALDCTGASGCHDLRLPDPGEHRDGALRAASANTFHLRGGFIAESTPKAWSVQLAFDDFCASACHARNAVPEMRHMGVTEKRPYLKLGNDGTDPGGGRIPGFPLDEDLTSAAPPGEPIFAPCVTCHDPHGTAAADVPDGSNHMVRLGYYSAATLCKICH